MVHLEGKHISKPSVVCPRFQNKMTWGLIYHLWQLVSWPALCHSSVAQDMVFSVFIHYHMPSLFMYYHPFLPCLFIHLFISWAGMLGEALSKPYASYFGLCRGGLADCMRSAKWLGPVQFNRSVPEGDVLWQVCKFLKVRGKRAWQADSTPLRLLPSKFFKEAAPFFPLNVKMDIGTR